uniref:Ubiquitin-like protease family profile domain-containing protein n=1 Tax=Pyricularia oryzae (strain P131) TaxID=1143193 RepID=L7JDT8_PYRO1
MSPSKHTLSLEQVTPLFSQPHVQSHQNFLSSLDKHNKIRRAELCRIKRDELLQSFRSIECLFALYSPVFQKYISERDCKEWNEFHKVAKEGSRRLNIIIKVTLAWGNEVVTHYNFVSQCRAHCENLRAVAWYNNKCQPWAKVVEILNASIRIRIQRNDGRSKVSDSRNPILPQDLVYAKRALKGDVKFVNEPTKELSEDYGFDQHGLIVRRRFAASSLSSSTFHDSPRLIIGNNDQDGFPRPTDPRSPSQLSSQAQRDIARDSNVAPTPSGQGPPSLSSHPTTPEAIDFATESPSSLRQCSTHTSPTEDNKSTLIPSTPLPASSASSAAPGLTANETSRQSSSSLMEISPSRSSISENNNHHKCTPLTTLSSVPHTVVKSIGCKDASRLSVAFSPSSPSSTSCQQCSRFAESPCVISDPAVPATAPYLSSISDRLLPSSPLATTKFRNSEPSLSPPEEFSHEAKSSMVETPEVACSEDDTAIEQEPSHTATVAFSSTVEATNNPTRSPSTDPNPAFLPPSVSPRSSFHHEITQTLTATSNCRVDGSVKCTVAPCLPTKPELVRKRPGSNSHESSPKKQKENDGDPTTALITPLRPLSAAASGSHRLDSHATINSTESTESTPSSPTLKVNPWLKDAMLSLDRLDQNKWLNDAIINAYIHILARRYEFCFLNSHFLQSVPTLSCKAEYGDPLESDFVLMPIYENHHWYLLVMYKSDTGDTAQNRIVCFLNSLESHPLSSDTSARWIQYLNNLGYQGLVRQRQVKVPQQSNSVDCGVFGLAFAYQIVENLQQFIDSVESGASLGWTIDASKWRRRLRRELELAYGLDSAAPDCKFKNTGHGDDETCADVISACHAFKAPKALKQALSLATVASFEATAVDLEITLGSTSPTPLKSGP